MRKLGSLAASTILMVSMPASACEFAQPSPGLLKLAVEQNEADANAILYGAIARQWPEGLSEETAGPILRDSVIPAVIRNSKGNVDLLLQQLRTRTAALCVALAGSGSSAPPSTVSKSSVETPQETSPQHNAQALLSAEREVTRAVKRPKLDASDAEQTKVGDETPAAEPAWGDTSAAGIQECKLEELDGNKARDVVAPMRACVQAAEKTYRELPEEARAQALPALRTIQARLAHIDANTSLFIGPRYSQNSGGDFETGAEILATWNAQAERKEKGRFSACLASFSWCRGYIEANYIKRELGDSETAAGLNPFASSGGVLKLNFGYRMRYNDWFGVTAGLGITSPQDVRPEDTIRTRPRAFLGLDYETVYIRANGGMRGFGSTFVGIAHDRFWRECTEFAASGTDGAGNCVRRDDNHGRYVIDTRYLLTNEGLDGWKLAARLFMDGPLSGEGDSDVGIGLLLVRDLDGWLTPAPVEE